jgi:hypothetical protein
MKKLCVMCWNTKQPIIATGDHIWAILRGVCLALHWYNPLCGLPLRFPCEMQSLPVTKVRSNGLERVPRRLRPFADRTDLQKTHSPPISDHGDHHDSGKNGIHERVMLIAKKQRRRFIRLSPWFLSWP